MIQMMWDRGEPNGYANHMTGDPLPGTPAHKVLIEMAYGDHQVSNVATEVEARTIGAPLRRPTLDAAAIPDAFARLLPAAADARAAARRPAAQRQRVLRLGHRAEARRTASGGILGTDPAPITNTAPERLLRGRSARHGDRHLGRGAQADRGSSSSRTGGSSPSATTTRATRPGGTGRGRERRRRPTEPSVEKPLDGSHEPPGELLARIAAGVLIDAFVVRSLLAPALITLIGEASGWPGKRLAQRIRERSSRGRAGRL